MSATVTLMHDTTDGYITFVTANIATVLIAKNGMTLVKLMNGSGYYVRETVAEVTTKMNGGM